MRKNSGQIVFILFLFLITFFIFKNTTFAGLTKSSFGGKIVATEIPDVTCEGGVGPITIYPSRSSYPESPYFIPTILNGTKVSSGKWILGLYSILPSEAYCQIQTPAGPVPFPVLVVKIYGASK